MKKFYFKLRNFVARVHSSPNRLVVDAVRVFLEVFDVDVVVEESQFVYRRKLIRDLHQSSQSESAVRIAPVLMRIVEIDELKKKIIFDLFNVTENVNF